MHRLKVCLLGFAILSDIAAAHLFIPGEGVRPTGMGGAFLAISDDHNALWYNPAGLVKIRGAHANLVDLTLGFDSTDTLNRVQNAFLNGDYQNLVRNDREFFRVNIRPTFFTKYFAIQPYTNTFSYFDLRALNSTDPLALLQSSVQVAIRNDIGVQVGAALPLGPFASVGLTARAIQRTGIETKLVAQDFISGMGMTQADIMANIFQNMMNRAGMGLGVSANAGLLVTLPLPAGYPEIRLAAVAEDIGSTRFLAIGSFGAPAIQPSAYHFGTSALYTWKNHHLNLALDLRNNFSDRHILHQLHAGAEYRHRFFALRTGIYQGYPTGGFSVEFPPHTRLHFSTYGSETGDGPWAESVRFYLAQLIIGFNPS